MMVMVSVTMVLAALIAIAVLIPVMIVGPRLKGSSQKENGEEKGDSGEELAMTPGHFFHGLNLEQVTI